jgi:tetratricopeptide (TPR) repeat protein
VPAPRADKRKHLRIATSAVLAAAAVVAAGAAALGKVPGIPSTIAAGTAAFAALAAVLAPQLVSALRAKQERSEAEHAATTRLQAHLDAVRRRYVEQMSAKARAGAPPEGGEQQYLERLVSWWPPPAPTNSPGAQRPAAGEAPEVASLRDLLSSEKHRVLLLGEGGSGKTTTLLEIAAGAAAAATVTASAPVPVYVELKNFDVSENGFARLFAMAANAVHGMEEREVDTLWRTGSRPFLFLLDGLNEQRGRAAACISSLQELAAREPHFYVVSSRPTPEVEALAAADGGFTVADLLPLNTEQIEQYLSAQRLGWLYERMDDALKHLSRNPFMLVALARSCEGLPRGELPHNMGQLYRTFVEGYIFGERETRRGLVTYAYAEVKKPILASLALRMTRDGVTVVPRDEQLVAAVEEKLEVVWAAARRRSVMPDAWDPNGLLDELVANGVMRATAGGIEFMHQSVQEFFTAVALAPEAPEDAVALVPPLIWRHVDVESETTGVDADHAFRVPVLMLAGLSPNADELIVALAAWDPLLAAACVAAAHVGDETAEMLRRQWSGLLDGSHERFRWIGARCFAASRIADAQVTRRLIDLATNWTSYGVSSAARGALRSTGIAGSENYLVEKITSPGRYDTPTQLLSELAPKRAIEVLIDHWRRAEDAEAKADIEVALLDIDDVALEEELMQLAQQARARDDEDLAVACEAAVGALPTWKSPPRIRNAQTLSAQLAEAFKRRRAAVAAAGAALSNAPRERLLGALHEGHVQRAAAVTEIARRKEVTALPALVDLVAVERNEREARDVAAAAMRVAPTDAPALMIARVWGDDKVVLCHVAGTWDGDGPFPHALADALGIANVEIDHQRREPRGQDVWTFPLDWGSTSDEVVIRRVDGTLEAALTGVPRRMLAAAAAVTPRELLQPEMLRALDHNDAGVRATAVDVLALKRDVETVDRLLALVAVERDAVVLARATRALAAQGTPAALNAVLEEVVRSRLDENALEVALGAAPDPAAVDVLLLERATVTDGHARSRVLRQLAHARRSRAASGAAAAADSESDRLFLLQTTLGEADSDTRTAAAEALRWARGGAAADALEAALADDDVRTRERAAEAAGVLQDEALALALAPLLADADVAVRTAAAASVVALRVEASMEEAVAVLIEIASGEADVALRTRSVRALGSAPSGQDTVWRHFAAQFDAGRHEEVAQALDRYLVIDDRESRLFWLRGLVRRHIGSFDAALSDLDRAESSFGAAVASDRAAVLAELGRFREAVDEQVRAVENNPRDSQEYLSLGWYQYEAGDYADAIASSLRAAELDTGDVGLMAAFNAALARLAGGHEEDAIRDYQRALELASRVAPDRAHATIDAARLDLQVLRERQPGRTAIVERVYELLAV